MALPHVKKASQEWPRPCDIHRLVFASEKPVLLLQGVLHWSTQREIFVRLCCLRDPFLPKLSKAERRNANALIDAALRASTAAFAATVESVLNLVRLHLALRDSCDTEAAFAAAQASLSTNLLDCPQVRAVLMQMLETSSWWEQHHARCSGKAKQRSCADTALLVK